MLVDSETARTLSLDKKEDDMKRLHEASMNLGGKKFEVASSLGRTSLGRENASVKGGLPGPGVGFPAPLSRRPVALPNKFCHNLALAGSEDRYIC